MPKNKAKQARMQRRQEARKAASRSAASSSAPSRPTQSDRSRWHQAPADSHALLRNKIAAVAKAKSEWAGIPMPLEDEQLVIEPRYPYAAGLSAIGAKKDDGESRFEPVNSWYSQTRQVDVHVFRRDGKLDWGIVPAIHSLDKQLRTLGCSVAWGIEQESKALDLLASMLPHRHFKQYLLTGSFLETSQRSRVTYMFRRLRPTVAIAPDKTGKQMRVLAALCLHPIGYYAGSWAGSMTPTDDVVAHLTLMRGDEAMFWRRSNQHPAYRPEAGL